MLKELKLKKSTYIWAMISIRSERLDCDKLTDLGLSSFLTDVWNRALYVFKQKIKEHFVNVWRKVKYWQAFLVIFSKFFSSHIKQESFQRRVLLWAEDRCLPTMSTKTQSCFCFMWLQVTDLHAVCVKEQCVLCSAVCLCLITRHIQLFVTFDPWLLTSERKWRQIKALCLQPTQEDFPSPTP